MNTIYILIFLSFGALAQVDPNIQIMPDPKSLEDFEHQFKGCPENSECDQIMGLQLTRWQDLVSKVKKDKVPGIKKASFVELYREKYGLPVEFYTYQKSQHGFKPLLFDSPCKEHNPKNGEKVLKGTAFLKSLSSTKAIAWRDQTQIEVPVGELLIPQPLDVYFATGPVRYLLPINDQPLFIKNNELYVLKEEDDYFYFLKISSSGEWKVVHFDMSTLSKYDNHRESVECPKEMKIPSPKIFGAEYCKTIWNEDLKKTVVVKMHQGCSI